VFFMAFSGAVFFVLLLKWVILDYIALSFINYLSFCGSLAYCTMSLSCFPIDPYSSGHEASPVIPLPGRGLKPGPRDVPGTWDAPMSIPVYPTYYHCPPPSATTENIPTYMFG